MKHVYYPIIWKSVSPVIRRVTTSTSLQISLSHPHKHPHKHPRPFACYNACSIRYASSSSSIRWQSRQAKDRFAREARVQGLKSRAAFKLLEINEKHHIFQRGQTVVDLGYAPGSWSQVAVDRTAPNGRVIGIDIIPAQPPKEVKKLLHDAQLYALNRSSKADFHALPSSLKDGEVELGVVDSVELESRASFVDGRPASPTDSARVDVSGRKEDRKADSNREHLVDVVLSDMSAPWEQTAGFWKKSLSDPYFRMMNTSGMSFRDHAGSMDLCDAALRFGFDTLRSGGHFICKFYQGAEDKLLETRLKSLFAKVHREKPESSRTESKEAYFVALRRKDDAVYEDVFRPV